jgi:putative membrane protein
MSAQKKSQFVRNLFIAAGFLIFSAIQVIAANESADRQSYGMNSQGKAGMGDAEILGLVNTINQNEIAAAEAASQKDVKQDVLNYASMMKSEHQNNMDQTNKVGQQVGVRPADDTAMIQKQKAKGEQELSKLSQLSGDRFAKAYMADMVKDHTEALNVIDHKLMKSAQTEEVRKHLSETRDHVAAHLEQAKSIQAGL